MDLNSLYHPPKPEIWTGRTANSPQYIYQKIQCQNITQHPTIRPGSIALIGFACDEGVYRNQGRRGASEGPKAIRQNLAPLALTTEIASKNIIDLGDISCTNHDLESAQETLGKVVEHVVKAKAFPFVLGGGHETAWGHYLGLSQYSKTGVGIINFDAHFDLRDLNPEGGHSGSPFFQISQNSSNFDYTVIGIQPTANTSQLFARAKQLGVKYTEAYGNKGGDKKNRQAVDEIISRCDYIYLSICLDVFSSAIAPGVSAPQPFGMTLDQIQPLILKLLASNKVIACDIVELAPPLDPHGLTSRLASRLTWEILRSYSDKN